MLRFAVSSLARRKGSAMGAFVALFFAAAMMCACGVVLETGLHGAIHPQRYAGTPVVVAADQNLHWTEVKHKHGKTKVKTKTKTLTERAWVPASVGDRLRQLPHAHVVADLIFPTVLLGSDGAAVPGVDGNPVWGHGWPSAALTPYNLVAGAPPRSGDEAVLDSGLAARAGLAVGDRIVLQSTRAPKTYRVVGIARARAAVTEESAVFVAAGEARRLAGHDGSAAYGVFGVTAEQARTAVDGTSAVVSTGDQRGAVEFVDATAARVQLVSVGGAIGGTSLVVGVLVVTGTFALSLQQRRRELALLRAVGATPRQVRRMVSGEALLIGLAAAIPGAVLGLPLARLLHAELVSVGAVPDTLQFALDPRAGLAAVAATVTSAWVAARITARRTVRVRPTEALSEADVQPSALGPGRVVVGVIATAAAAAVTLLLRFLHTEPASMPVTYLCVLLWMTAVALLGPLLTRAAMAGLAVPLRALPVTGFLAGANAKANSRRLASVVTPLALLVAMSLTILCAPATINEAARVQLSHSVTADHVVTGTGPGIPSAAARTLRDLPGVVAITEVLPTTVWLGRHKHPAEAVTPAGLTSTINPGVTSGSLTALGPGTVAMSDRAAGGHRVGDLIGLTLGDGTRTRARLVAIYSRGLAFGDLLLPYDEVAGHVDDPLAQAILVKGTAPPERVTAALAGFAGLRVAGADGYDAVQASHRRLDTDVSLIFMALILAFAAIAVVNTSATAIADRSREMSLIRLIGATAGQVRRVLLVELALVFATAAAVGTAAAWLTLNGFTRGMVGSGTPAFAPATCLAVVAVAAALGVIGTLPPAEILLRRDRGEDS